MSHPEMAVFIELYVRDVRTTVDMLVDVVGAECRRLETDFAEVKHGASRILLNGQPIAAYEPGNPIRDLPNDFPRGAGVEICIEISDVETAFSRAQACEVLQVVSPLQLRSWGLRDFRVVHADGFFIRVTSPI